MHRATGGSLLLAVAILGGCAREPGSNSVATPAPAVASAPPLLADLCAAQEGAADPAAARTAFARAHGPLHDLAQEVQGRDRASAARLLEDKQQVETALERPAGPGELAVPLAELVESARRALEAVGSPAPPCPG